MKLKEVTDDFNRPCYAVAFDDDEQKIIDSIDNYSKEEIIGGDVVIPIMPLWIAEILHNGKGVLVPLSENDATQYEETLWVRPTYRFEWFDGSSTVQFWPSAPMPSRAAILVGSLVTKVLEENDANAAQRLLDILPVMEEVNERGPIGWPLPTLTKVENLVVSLATGCFDEVCESWEDAVDEFSRLYLGISDGYKKFISAFWWQHDEWGCIDRFMRIVETQMEWLWQDPDDEPPYSLTIASDISWYGPLINALAKEGIECRVYPIEYGYWKIEVPYLATNAE